MCVTRDRFAQVRGGGMEGSGAGRQCQGQPTFNGIEVGARGEGQDGEVAEGRGRGAVKDRREGSAAIGVVTLSWNLARFSEDMPVEASRAW